jgi:hypothetical protein
MSQCSSKSWLCAGKLPSNLVKVEFSTYGIQNFGFLRKAHDPLQDFCWRIKVGHSIALCMSYRTPYHSPLPVLLNMVMTWGPKFHFSNPLGQSANPKSFKVLHFDQWGKLRISLRKYWVLEENQVDVFPIPLRLGTSYFIGNPYQLCWIDWQWSRKLQDLGIGDGPAWY